MATTFLRRVFLRSLACAALLMGWGAQPVWAQTTNPVVFGAWYGTETAPYENVGVAPVAGKIRNLQQQNGGTTVVVPAAMNAFFGADPVPNTPKVVAVFVNHNGVNYNLRQSEGRELRFPGVEGRDYSFGKLDVVSAAYGPVGAAASPNVLNRILANMKAGVVAVPPNMNVFFGGDPAPNVPKQLSVTLRNQGQLYEFRQIEGRDFRFPGVLGQDYFLPNMTPPATTPVVNTLPSTTTANTGTNAGDNGELFEDVPDMSDIEIQMVMDWIKNRATSAKLPFCWKQSDPRGVGTIPGRVADCPSGYTNNGATCGRGANTIAAPSRLANCPAGYTNMGLSCFRNAHTVWKGCKVGGCAPGYTDFGCTCTRGPDSMSMDAMICAAGFFKGADARCHRDCPTGYTNTGETCFRPVSTLGLDAMTCNRPGERKVGGRCFPAAGSCYGDEQEQNGLCYRNCKPGFGGEGPVCWQQCQPGWVNCGAGCAKNSGECGKVVGEQVYAPLVVAANVATLGLSSTATAGVQGTVTTLTIGSKTISSGTKVGKALITLITKARSMNLQESLPLTRRIFNSKLGMAKGASTFTTLRKVGMTTYKGTANTWQSINDYAKAYAEDFSNQTSPEINDILNKSFHPDTASFLKETWARQQFAQMATTEGWIAADNALNWIGMIDITGVTSVVSAYAKPVCQDATELPCTSASLNCKTAFDNLHAPAPVELKVTPLSKFSCWDNCAANPSRGLSAEVADKVCGNAAQCESMCGIAGTAQACLATNPPKITQRECKDIPGAECGDGFKPPPFSCSECTTTEGLCSNLGKCSRQCNNVLQWGEGQLATTVLNPLTWDQRLTMQANVCFTRELLTPEICAANSPARQCRTVPIDPPPGAVRVADGSKSMVANPPGTFAYLAQGDMILSDSENSMMRMDFNGVLSTYTKQMDGSWQLAASLGRRKTPTGGNYFAQLAWYGQLCVASGDPTGKYTLQNCIHNQAEPNARYQLVVKDPSRPGDVPAIEMYMLENIEGMEFRKSAKPTYNSVADGWRAR
jgi:hypothetical protein